MRKRNLYEIYVPCKFEDTQGFVRRKHHEQWDSYVTHLAGGLTVYKPVRGTWLFNNAIYKDRVIPVRICCTENQIKLIGKFTVRHYRQKSVMYYKLSDEVTFIGDCDEGTR